jgi:hypothetical protein
MVVEVVHMGHSEMKLSCDRILVLNRVLSVTLRHKLAFVLRCHPRRHSPITTKSPWNWRWYMISQLQAGEKIASSVRNFIPKSSLLVLLTIRFWECFPPNRVSIYGIFHIQICLVR